MDSLRESQKNNKVKSKNLKYDSESEVEQDGEFNIDINLKNVFERETNAIGDLPSKVGVDRCMIYMSGPITSYCESPLSIPVENIPEPEKVAVTKIACGWDHMIVLLENHTVYVIGNNAQGQLNYDPKIKPKIEDKLEYHEKINSKYDVIDIGCGSNHSVFIVSEKSDPNSVRKIMSCGYHGCLGVDNVNEDDHHLHQVLIPGISDYDNIEFLI